MLLRAVLTIALGLAAWQGLAASASAAEVTHVGRFRFLPRATVIMLPITGPLASLAWDDRPRMPAQRVDYLELPGLGDRPVRMQGRLVRSLDLRRHRLVRRILVAQNRPGVVRIAVRGTRAVRLVPDYTRQHGRWYLRVRIVPYRAR